MPVPVSYIEIDNSDIFLGKTVHLYCGIAGVPPEAVVENITLNQHTSYYTVVVNEQEFLGGSGFNDEDLMIHTITDFNDGNIGRYVCTFDMVLDNKTFTIRSQGLDLILTGMILCIIIMIILIIIIL